MNPGLIFSSLPLIGIVIGLLGARVRLLPWIAAGIVTVAYLLYLASFGIYAAQCWDCSGDFTATRGDSFMVSALLLGLMLLVTIAGIALGARFSVVLGRLVGAARDVRDSLRNRDGDARDNRPGA
jgi:uncharacterized membrane protein